VPDRAAAAGGLLHEPGEVVERQVVQVGEYDVGVAAEEAAVMTRAVHVPYTVEQDEGGMWCAHAELRAGVGANGEGETAEAAVADLRDALEALIAEFGIPGE